MSRPGEHAAQLANRGPAMLVAVDQAEALLAAGTELLVVEGDMRASRQRFDLAYRAAQQAGDPDAMAVAALGLGGLRVDEQRTAEASALLQARLEHALSLVDSQSLLALRLRVRLTCEAEYRAGRHEAVLTILDEARRTADPVTQAEALSLAHHCLLGPGHGRQRRALANELIRQSCWTGRRSDLLMGLLWATVNLFLDGDRHAERQLAELRDQLAQRDHLAIGFVADAMEVMLTIRSGRFDEAEALAQTCVERGATAGDIDVQSWYVTQLVAIRWYQGRLADLVPMLTEVVHSPDLSTVDNSYLAALALAAATAEDRRTAASAVARVRGQSLADLPRSPTWLVTLHGIVEAAHVLEDASTSALAYELLEPFAQLPVVSGLGVACFGSVHHLLGVASMTTGHLDRAVEHFRNAIEGNLALGHWPALRVSRLRYAEARTRCGRTQDGAVVNDEPSADAHDSVLISLPAPAPAFAAISAAAAPEPALAAPEPVGLVAICTREGRQWRFELGTRSTLVQHSIGMLHLAVLLANPKVEIPAIELVAGVAALGISDGHSSLSAQPMLDPVASRQYRHRLSQLSAEIDELGPDDERGARARAEREWLIGELAAGTGLAGRARRMPDSSERARLSVGKAIRRAITRVDVVDPLIGEHLRRRVHTGMRCWYLPT